MNDRVTINIEDGVADVRMVRVDKMNALDNAMFEALVGGPSKRLKTEKGRTRRRALRARAAPSARRAGTWAISDAWPRGRAVTRPSPRLTKVPARLHARRRQPRPVRLLGSARAAAGPSDRGCARGGVRRRLFQVALGADMRYVTPDARMAVMEIKWGLIPDMAGTQLMRHLAREDIVRELTYTGRIFSGEEAFQYGFATRVCADPRAEALATAREIAGKSPYAVRAANKILNAAVMCSARDGLTMESVEQGHLIGSPNQIEAVTSNLQKRAPAYAD